MVILHSMEDLYVFFHIVIVFLGFCEVLRKQGVFGGTFPIPLKTCKCDARVDWCFTDVRIWASLGRVCVS